MSEIVERSVRLAQAKRSPGATNAVRTFIVEIGAAILTIL